MVLDQPQLQLVFNVIALTGVSAFGTISYLLKRDYEQLLAKINTSREQDQHHPKEPAALPAPEARPARDVPPARDTDIRRYVTQRAQTWTAPSASQWKPCRDTAASALSRRPFYAA